MNKSSNKSIAEGLIRPYELFESLIIDVNYSYEISGKDKSLQPLRRNIVRTTFSFIEGVIQILKYELKSGYRLNEIDIKLSSKENEILYELRTLKREKIPWNIPLDLNLKKTFILAIKVWELEKELINFSTISYQTFLEAKNIRNRLTHPKTFYDIQISEEEIQLMALTYFWIKDSFILIMKNKVENILKTIPEDYLDSYAIQKLKAYSSSYTQSKE